MNLDHGSRLHHMASPPDHILIVEDDEGVAELMADELSNDGLACRRVASGQECLNWLSDQDADLLILDYSLPDMTGQTLVEQLKAANRLQPFVVTTGFGDEELAVQLMKLGALDYLVKDSRLLGRLPGVIRRVLGEVGTRRRLEAAERALQESEQRFREQAALLDVTSDAVVVLDVNEIVSFWNRGAERAYGWTSAEAVGRRVSELVKTMGDEREFDRIRAILRERGEWSGEVRRTNRAGVTRIIQSRATLVRGADGAPRSVLIVDTDMTEAKHLEAQFLRAQRLDSLGKLASGVAHDLNNVLTPILMSTQLLQRLAKEPADRELVQLLTDSANRGAEVVRQLLVFGRGSDKPRVRVNLGTAAAEVARMIVETFPKDIVITTSVPADLRPVVADPTQVHQVLLNLCVNARDAMPDGGMLALAAANVTLDASVVEHQPGATAGPHVVLQVSDTGTGIPPEILDKIYDPFFTTKPLGSGTGLGLSTVLGIVRSHGGFLTVQSRIGIGTEFAIYLPTDGPESIGQALAMDSPARIGQGELILVVEDELSIRTVMCRALEEANYRVLVAANGSEAIGLFHQHQLEIRAAVTDLMMPVMDGLQMIQALRAIEPTLPVIALSGLHSWQERLRNVGLGDVRFLPKPTTSDALIAALQQVFAGRPELTATYQPMP